ncbi:MAG: DUF2796 domain-containing protein [bacterium]|nr:DUF2796 domain-containing protein [bacterium]
MCKLYILTFATLPFFAASPILAKEPHRQLDAHIHGHGELNMALEGNKLNMELHVPGKDIVGFEHEPNTKEQWAAIGKARSTLAHGLKLFILPKAAQCKQISSTVNYTHDEGEDSKHDEHDKEHKETVEGKEHGEFKGNYVLKCAAPEKLTSIQFDFFAQFPGSKELVVTLITEKSQKQYEVERDQPSLKGLTP